MPDYLSDDMGFDESMDKRKKAADDLLEGLGAGMDDEPKLKF